MGNIIHSIGNTDFNTYEYHSVLINGNATLHGETINTTAPIIIPVGVTNSSQVTGAIFLIGKKRPELLSSINSDGTLSIKG
jgi:hypothetical protein